MKKPLAAIFLLLFLSPVFSNAQTLPLFTKKYECSVGKPLLYTENFEACNTSSSYTIIVENGDVSGKNRVSSGSIMLNGREIVGERDFNQKVAKIERSLTLLSENMLTVKLASAPDSFIKVSIVCVANCLDVEVISPNDGSLANGSKTIVKGRIYNAIGEAGVTVTNEVTEGSARFLAERAGENFAGILPLTAGVNKITVTATDACGLKAIDTVSVNAEAVEEKIRLTIMPSSGVLSVDGRLDVEFEADAYIEGISNYSWDFEGDGVFDETGGGLLKATHSYEQTGLYFPTVKVTDINGNVYTEIGIVGVMSREEVDALLKNKWDGMKGGLAGGNTDKVLRYISSGSKEKYGEIFNLLKDKLPSLGKEMQDIAFLYVKGKTAKYRVRRNQVINGQGVTVTYYVYFTVDENGIWKIVSF